MIIYKNIVYHRGDRETIRFDYPGNIALHNLSFVLKKDRELTSSRLLEINKVNSLDNQKFTALFDENKNITQITIFPDVVDTQDLSGSFVFDIYDNTDFVTRIDGNFYVEPDVQTPYDGTNLPSDGRRYIPYYPENFNDKEVLQFNSAQKTFSGITPGSLVDNNFYNKSEVDETLSNKVDEIPGKGLSTNDFSNELKNQFDANNQLQTSGIKDSSVTFPKLSFLKTGKNLFNFTTQQTGKYVNPNVGILNSNPSYNCSDYIPITSGNIYTANYLHYAAFYNSSKIYISGIDNSSTNCNKTFTAPPNSAYFLFDFPVTSANVQLETGNSITPYEAYCKYIDAECIVKLRAQFLASGIVDNNTIQLFNEVISIKSVPASLIGNGIKAAQINYISTGKNLYNKLNEIVGYYVSNINGSISTGDGTFNVSDFIPVYQSTQYTLNHARMIAFYNSTKVYISGIDNGSNNSSATFMTPVSVAYIRFCYVNTNTAIQFELGNTVTSYESFRYIINTDSSVPVYAKNIDLSNSVDNSTIQLLNGLLSLKSVPFNALVFIGTGKNLFNLNTQTIGYYANSNTGYLSANSSYDCSDYIPVSALTQYSCNYIRMVAFYDVNKIFLSGVSFSGGGNITGNFTTVANTAYCRISYSNAVTNIQLEPGAKCTTYESYRYVISQQSSIPIFVKNVDESGFIFPRLVLPSKIYVATGREMNLWYNALNYEIDCDKRIYHKCIANFGLDLSDCFRYSPAVAESNSITIQVYSSELNNIASANTTIQSVVNNSGSGTKQILFIGDSFISQNIMLSEIRNLILADGGIAPVLLGTQGVSPNQHEGRSGWTFAKYIANTSDGSYNNIFWDTSIEDNNFKKYMADHNFSGDIDYCVIYLGFNDITSVTGSGDASDANLDVIISNAKNLIDDILSSTHGYPNCKIILVFPTLFPIDRTSWASHYSDTTGNLIDLRHKRNMFLYYQKLITNFDNGTYNQNVSVCASSFWMDRSNSFQSFKILSRNRSMRDTTKESYISDVHPSNVGYYYLADAIYSHLRALF